MIHHIAAESRSSRVTVKKEHTTRHVVITLCQEMKTHLSRKVGFEGTPKNGSVLEVTTCSLQGTYVNITPQMTFSRCNSVHKMATGKSDDQSIQPDNKL